MIVPSVFGSLLFLVWPVLSLKHWSNHELLDSKKDQGSAFRLYSLSDLPQPHALRSFARLLLALDPGAAWQALGAGRALKPTLGVDTVRCASILNQFNEFGSSYGDSMGSGFGGMAGFGSSRFGVRGVERDAPRAKVPVSILCGFLGAGKTTLVSQILRNREGLKVGVVVNDVAETNIDSEVLSFEDADGIIGLQNGCACCSGRDDLFARLQQLVESDGISKLDRNWDRLVVECSGVAEPESIASELEAMGRRGEDVMKRIFLAGIICVVDASTFWDSYNEATKEAAAAIGKETAEDMLTDRKPLSALLVNQLESSDTVIINKADLVSPEELARTEKLLKALCPNARHLVSTQGDVPLRTLLPAEPISLDMPAYVPSLENRHDVAVSHAKAAPEPSSSAANDPHSHSHDCHDEDCNHASHDASHDHSHEHCHDEDCSHESHGHSHEHGHDEDCAECNKAPSAHQRFGINSFVYRRSEPFKAQELATIARQLPIQAADLEIPGVALGEPAPSPIFEGVLRSKGFVKVVGSEASYYWSHAGRQLQLTGVDSKADTRAKRRGQELVFIGVDMDEAGIVRVLDACLDRDGAEVAAKG